MPCVSDYMNPNTSEATARQCAKFMVFICGRLFVEPSKETVDAAKDCYGRPFTGESATAKLCNMLQLLEPATLEAIVYDAKDKTSRLLATWWEDHCKADKKHEAEDGLVDETDIY